jgi:hypothetical protein
MFSPPLLKLAQVAVSVVPVEGVVAQRLAVVKHFEKYQDQRSSTRSGRQR